MVQVFACGHKTVIGRMPYLAGILASVDEAPDKEPTIARRFAARFFLIPFASELGRWNAPTHSMELRYSTTRALLAWWYWRSLRRNRRHQLFWIAWVVFAFALGAQQSAHRIRSGLLASMGVIAFLAIMPQLFFKPQERVLDVGPEGLTTTIGAKTGELAWRDIARVEREGEYVVVTGRQLHAFLIPTSAFPASASDQAIEQWGAGQRTAADPST